MPTLSPCCPVCQKPVTRKGKRGPLATYCSQACRYEHNQSRCYKHDRVCETCGKPFKATTRTQRNCSNACRSAHSYRNQRRACAECGAEFFPTTRAQVYCSQACGQRRKAERRPIRQCTRCGKPFQSSGWATCRKCTRLKVDRMRNHRRRRWLRGAGERIDPHDVYERDGWVCGICGGSVDKATPWPHPDSPSIDHIVPVSRGGEHTMANVRCAHLRCNALKGDKMGEMQGLHALGATV